MSRPKSITEPRVNMALRLPVALHAQLKAEAYGRDVSVNWLTTRAVERYLVDLHLGTDRPAEVAAMLRDGDQ